MISLELPLRRHLYTWKRLFSRKCTDVDLSVGFPILLKGPNLTLILIFFSYFPVTICLISCIEVIFDNFLSVKMLSIYFFLILPEHQYFKGKLKMPKNALVTVFFVDIKARSFVKLST